jgi:hypothetical protein
LGYQGSLKYQGFGNDTLPSFQIENMCKIFEYQAQQLTKKTA